MNDNLSYIQNRELIEFLKIKDFAGRVMSVEMDNSCSGFIV